MTAEDAPPLESRISLREAGALLDPPSTTKALQQAVYRGTLRVWREPETPDGRPGRVWTTPEWVEQYTRTTTRSHRRFNPDGLSAPLPQTPSQTPGETPAGAPAPAEGEREALLRVVGEQTLEIDALRRRLSALEARIAQRGTT